MSKVILIDGPADGHTFEPLHTHPVIRLVVPDGCDRVWWFADELPEPSKAIGASMVHYDYAGTTPAGTKLYVHEPAADVDAIA